MARRKVDPKNSLATRCPELIKDWDYDLNEHGPEDFDYMSKASVHWKCHKNPEHKWMAVVAKVVTGAVKCPGCNPGFNINIPTNKPKLGTSLAEVCPEAAKEWYQPYNGTVTPENVTAGQSHSRYWFKCSNHGTIWMAACSDRKDGKGCPVCRSEKISAMRSTLKPGDSLADKYPELTTEWNILLNTTTPDKVFAHGRDNVHWICEKGHMWTAVVCNRTCNGSGCPKCGYESSAEKNRIPEAGYSLLGRFPIIASEFACTEYGVKDASMVAYSSNVMCTWHCSVCGEATWEATPNSRTARGIDAPGCSACASKRAGLYNTRPKNGIYLKDGAPSIAAEWDEIKNREELGLELETIALHSNKDAYWICPYCGEPYLMTVNKRTTRGDGHPSCSLRKRFSFPEKAVLYYIRQAFPDAVGNAHPKEIAGLGNKELDVWIPSKKTGIEYDGQGWHQNPDSERKKDAACAESGVTLIRIREPKCVKVHRGSSSIIEIERDPNSGFKSLDDAIVNTLEYLGTSLDVNTMRDEGVIRTNMGLAHIRDSLAREYPDISLMWCHALNNGLTPDMFKASSNREVYWNCEHGHEPFKRKIVTKVSSRNNGCPKCLATQNADG